VLYDLEQFVDSINARDLQIIGHEGALAFGGTGPELKSILLDTTDIVNQLSSSEDSMLRLLDNSAILLHGAAAHASAFDRFSGSLKSLTTVLAAKTPTITKFLNESVPTTRIVNSLIADNGSAITTLLANLASLSQIQVARVPGLRSLLVAVPEFGRLAPTVVHDGALLGAANINGNQKVCNTGVPLTSPISAIKSRIFAARCGTDLARGAANAPRPGGGTGTSSLGASAIETSDGTQIGTYNPQTGLVSTSNGSLVRLGVNGGQTELFGGNSWQALLLAGTGS
jgi:phospholipid/cholesterol/gamma-HCH transport system substrate-binding protein